MLAGKNLIIMHPSGRSACSFYRLLFMEALLRSDAVKGVEVIVAPVEIEDSYILSHTAAVIIQRPTVEFHETLLRRYKNKRGRYGFRIFADYDDLLFDIDGEESVPEYNIARTDSTMIAAFMEENLANVDGVTVSTRFLKDCMVHRFGWKHVSVVPNAVPRFLFGRARRAPVEADLAKPRVLYGGSITHFREGDPGDFAGPWIPWLLKAVREDRIDLHVFGNPGFLEPVAEKVTFHTFVSALEYPSAAAAIAPDIYLAPLQENHFNRAKSNLKLIEATALGAVLLGSHFPAGPYEEAHPYSKVYADTTVEELDAQLELITGADEFNGILEHQYKVMDMMGYWMESRHYIKRYLQAFLGALKVDENVYRRVER